MKDRLPVYLLPGLDGTGALFAPFVNVAPDSLEPRVISYPVDTFLDYTQLADMVRRSVPAEQPFALVAESFSGPVALLVAATVSPENLVGVVLVSSFVQNPVSAIWPGLRHLVFRMLFALPPPAFAVRRLLTGPDAPGDLVADVQAAIRSVRSTVLANRVRAVMSLDVREELSKCPAPLLYLRAERDAIIKQATIDQLKRDLPDMAFCTLPAPHLVLQRCPREAAGIIWDFLRKAPKAL